MIRGGCGEQGLGRSALLAQLRRCRLFRGFSDGELSGLLERCPRPLRSCPAGTLVHGRGEPYESLLVILQGQLAAEMQDPGGRVLKVETLAAPAVVASSILFARHNLLPVSLTASSPVRLLALPRSAVLDCCRRESSFLEALLEDMGDRAAFLAEKLRLTQFATLRQKLGSFLLTRCGPGETVALSMSRQAMADVLGAQRPSVSRVLAGMAREGLLRLEGGRVRLLDRAALQHLLEDAQ